MFVTLNVPLTGWWETAHKLKEKEYALEQARIDRQYLGTQLDLRSQQAYDQLEDAVSMLQIQQRTVIYSEQLYEQASANYEVGLGTITELLQAQMNLTQAKSDWTDAQIAYRVQKKRYEDLCL